MEWAGFWIFLALMFIFFSGEPDLRQALIRYFVKKAGGS